LKTRIDEITGGIYRISTFLPEFPPIGFTFNQYLIVADEPLLFHCGGRGIFPQVSAAVAEVMPVSSLRWISFGHIESDESGSMNQWLAAAPQAQVMHGATACMVSLVDLADRPPRQLADGEVVDLGGKSVRYIDTPHVPHAWESGLLFEETTRTLFTGDLFTHFGDGPPIDTRSIVADAIAAEDGFHSSALTPSTAPTIRKLKTLRPARLAVMHGSCFSGDCAAELETLAAYFDARLHASLPA
jgi:flavorubredoxin